MNLWITNTKGEKSASLTLVIVAFSVVMLHMIAAIVAPMAGLAITAFDASESMLVLGPLLGLYFGRRYTDSKEETPGSADG